MKMTVFYDKNGNVKKIKTNVGRTRMNRAALELWRGNAEPTTGYKLRRFIKRLFREIGERTESACMYHLVGSPQACDVPHLYIEENVR